jgi:hypothetical protein
MTGFKGNIIHYLMIGVNFGYKSNKRSLAVLEPQGF